MRDRPVYSGYLVGKPDGGPECEAFERELQAYYGVPYARVFNSATSALHSALAAVGVSRDDRVVVPAYSMSASAAAIVHCGAWPVFADIDDHFCLSHRTVKAVRTERTKAMVLVHLNDLHWNDIYY